MPPHVFPNTYPMKMIGIPNTDAYVDSEAGATSPLSRLPGHHNSTVWYEIMHSGPLGVLQHIGACVLIDHCDSGARSCYHGCWRWMAVGLLEFVHLLYGC